MSANPTSTTAQVAVFLPAKTCNGGCCPRCVRCRVAAHRARNKFQQEKRSGMGMSFDGRCSGKLRNIGRDRPAGYAERMTVSI